MRQLCAICDQAHAKPRPGASKFSRCITHDLNTYVDKRLATHRGLPEDCPGCLGSGTIEKAAYGNRAGGKDLKLTCRECRTVYLWSER